MLAAVALKYKFVCTCLKWLAGVSLRRIAVERSVRPRRRTS